MTVVNQRILNRNYASFQSGRGRFKVSVEEKSPLQIKLDGLQPTFNMISQQDMGPITAQDLIQGFRCFNMYTEEYIGL